MELTVWFITEKTPGTCGDQNEEFFNLFVAAVLNA